MKTTFLFGLVVTVYLSLNLSRPQGLTAYLLPSVCWGLVALSAAIICGLRNIQKWLNQNIILAGLLIGISQVTVLVFISFFTGFAKSPYQFTPMSVTLILTYFLPMLLAFELSRAHFIKSCPKKKANIGIGLIGLFYALIRFPTASLLTMGTPPETLEFLGSNFLPTLARSIVATFLALLGGPIASIAYLGSLDAVQWLSPILPNPGWTIEALIGTLIPTIGLVATIQTTNPFALMRSGIISKSEVKRNIRRTKRSFPLTWTAVILVGVILVWGSTGLLGFKPSVIASGSMRPALDVGDIVVVQKVDSMMIQPGDIIQYLKENVAITHRVVNIYRDSGGTFFITKGDANSVSDDPVSERAVVGKTLFTIPKIGWVSIFLRTAAVNIFEFFMRNLGIAYAAIAAMVMVSVLVVRSYRNQPLRRVRRRISK